MTNKKEKTYLEGVLHGFALTALFYSILIGIIIRMLTP